MGDSILPDIPALKTSYVQASNIRLVFLYLRIYIKYYNAHKIILGNYSSHIVFVYEELHTKYLSRIGNTSPLL